MLLLFLGNKHFTLTPQKFTAWSPFYNYLSSHYLWIGVNYIIIYIFICLILKEDLGVRWVVEPVSSVAGRHPATQVLRQPPAGQTTLLF
jgi:hypothetical protein